MQIRHKKTNRKALSEIQKGGCYYDPEAESYNIRTSKVRDDGEILTINLSDGEYYYEKPGVMVVPVKAEVVILED
jgi:hypothetical protein